MGTAAMVLSGGGAKGCFQLGAAWYLYRAAHLRPTLISGTSVGAVNGLKLAEGGYTAPGDLLPDDAPLTITGGGERGIVGLWQLWRSLRCPGDMYSPTAPFLAMHDQGDDITAALTSGTGPSPAALEQDEWLSLSIPFLGLLFGFVTIDAVETFLDNLRALLQVDSLYTLDPIAQRIVGTSPTVNLALIDDASIELVVASVGADSAALRYTRLLTDPTHQLTNEARVGQALDEQTNPLPADPVPFWQAVLGSAAIPTVFAPETFAGEKNFDGGVRNIVPMRPALAARCERIFALVCSAPENPRLLGAPDPNQPSPAAPVDDRIDTASSPLLNDAARALDLITDQIIKWEMRPQADWPASVYEIRPEINVLGTAEIDPGQIAIAAAYGYDIAFDLIDPTIRSNTARQYLRDLDTETAWLRMHAWREQREQRDVVVYTLAIELQAALANPANPAAILNAVANNAQHMIDTFNGSKFALADASGRAAASVGYRQLWPHPIDPLPSQFPLPDTGWTTPADIRFPAGSSVSTREQVFYDTSNQQIHALNTMPLNPTPMTAAPPPADVWNRTTTWRNSTGGLRHTTWGILSEEFGRAPAAFRGYRPDSTYTPGDPGGNGNEFTPMQGARAAIHFGQRLDLLTWTDKVISLNHRGTGSDPSGPWNTETVLVVPDGARVLGAALMQEPSDAPGILTVAATLQTAEGVSVQLVYSSRPGIWDLGETFTGTGEAALLLQDVGGGCRTLLMVPNGGDIDIYYRLFGTFNASTSAPNLMLAQWTKLTSIPLVEHVTGTTTASVITGVAACQSNHHSNAPGHTGDLVILVRYDQDPAAGPNCVAILTGDLDEGVKGGPMTIAGPLVGPLVGPESPVVGVTAVPAILQLHSGRYTVLLPGETEVAEYRSATPSPTGWNKHRTVHSGGPLISPGPGDPHHPPPVVHLPSAASAVGITQADDGSPGDVLAYLRVVSPTETTHFLARSDGMQGPWTQDPSPRRLQLLNI